MEYRFSEDMKTVREILELTQMDLAVQIGVEQVTISRSETQKTMPSSGLLENFYDFTFKHHINLGRLKEMFWREDIQNGHKLLFHGAKDQIVGPLDVHKGRKNNDFGQGFYTGESYAQAISFVANFDKSCVYLMDFDGTDLTCKEYFVDQEWMLTIAYYRGNLSRYQDHPRIIQLINESQACDYICAPIADNRMFQIINSFIEGEITDEQCKHCLAATNLGKQYVFKSKKSIMNLALAERCYISESEREYYRSQRSADTQLGIDKVKVARIRYRGKGKYIDEILV